MCACIEISVYVPVYVCVSVCVQCRIKVSIEECGTPQHGGLSATQHHAQKCKTCRKLNSNETKIVGHMRKQIAGSNRYVFRLCRLWLVLVYARCAQCYTAHSTRYIQHYIGYCRSLHTTTTIVCICISIVYIGGTQSVHMDCLMLIACSGTDRDGTHFQLPYVPKKKIL